MYKVLLVVLALGLMSSTAMAQTSIQTAVNAHADYGQMIAALRTSVSASP